MKPQRSSADVLRAELARMMRKDAPSKRECELMFALDDALRVMDLNAALMPRTPSPEQLRHISNDPVISLNIYNEMLALGHETLRKQQLHLRR